MIFSKIGSKWHINYIDICHFAPSYNIYYNPACCTTSPVTLPLDHNPHKRYNKIMSTTWTEQTVVDFKRWLNRRGGDLILPVQETMNGEYVMSIALTDEKTAEELLAEYVKEIHSGENIERHNERTSANRPNTGGSRLPR